MKEKTHLIEYVYYFFCFQPDIIFKNDEDIRLLNARK